MSKGKNIVGLILDETGSMLIRKVETIGAVNHYLDMLRDEKARVTFATFNHSQGVKFHALNEKAKDVSDIDKSSYNPSSMTNLLDALGRMIAEIDKVATKNDIVLIMTVTDGQENCSEEFNLEQIKQLIEQRERSGWKFSYIGATVDAWGKGQSMGISVGASLDVSGQQMGVAMNVASDATSRYFSSSRAGAPSVGKAFYSDEDRDKVSKS